MLSYIKLFFIIASVFEVTYSFQSYRDFEKSKVFINNGSDNFFLEIWKLSKFMIVKKNKILDQVKVYTEDDTISFFVIGDWGGIPVFPYR